MSIGKIVSFLILGAAVIAAGSCNGRNAQYVKDRAEKQWSQMGYQNPGYEGYQWSLFGGDVWYTVTRKDSPGVVYSGYLCKRPFSEELVMYGPRVVSGPFVQVQQKRE